MLQIALQCLQNLCPVFKAALAAPGQVAQRPFAEQIPRSYPFQRAQVGVGNLCECLAQA
jgi:hypothetical protein